ncbi:MAG: serine hydrolase, partial [Pirellulaceae bacterium]|nr:serine hydrolase [Pirellulaceae bacterium]
MKNYPYLRLIVCLLLLPTTSSAAEQMLYFPPVTGAWEQVDPAQAGWNVDRLKDAIKYAGEQKSSGVVILYRGRILLEKYWPLDPPAKDANGRPNRYYHLRVGKNAQGRAIEDVASAQKSVSAMLVGIAQHKGLLEIEDPVHKHLGKGWSKAPAKAEAKITIRHLITMTSGLTTALEYEVPAGKKWMYNTNAYSRSLMCVAKAAKMKPNELTTKWLTAPTG